MKIVTTPTEAWLNEEITHCRSQIIVASPYVGLPLPELFKKTVNGVQRIVITNMDLKSFALGSSSLKALCNTADTGATIYGLQDLHAKVYILDRRAALVSSANVTSAGLYRNWECGVAIYDRDSVSELAQLALSGFGASASLMKWTAKQIASLKEPVDALAHAISTIRPIPITPPDDEQERILTKEDKEILLQGAGGWTALTLEGIAEQKEAEFSLDELLTVCLPKAKMRYPRNTFVRAKLRQQLQVLRNQGLVQFLGMGHYRFILGATHLEGDK